jgi:hypothetical protein
LFFVLKPSFHINSHKNNIMDNTSSHRKRKSSESAATGKENDENKLQRTSTTSSTSTVHLHKRCGLGDACKNPTGALAARYKCEECRIAVHPGLCGLTGDLDAVYGEKYWCPPCLAKVKPGAVGASPAANSSSTKSELVTTSAATKPAATKRTAENSVLSPPPKNWGAKDVASWQEIQQNYKGMDDIVVTGAEESEQVRCGSRAVMGQKKGALVT